MSKTSIGCFFPNGIKLESTTVVKVSGADVVEGEAVELVSDDAGVKTVKALTDGAKLFGVMTDATKVDQNGDCFNVGLVNIDAIVLADGIKPLDLTQDANPRIILKSEV